MKIQTYRSLGKMRYLIQPGSHSLVGNYVIRLKSMVRRTPGGVRENRPLFLLCTTKFKEILGSCHDGVERLSMKIRFKNFFWGGIFSGEVTISQLHRMHYVAISEITEKYWFR